MSDLTSKKSFINSKILNHTSYQIIDYIGSGANGSTYKLKSKYLDDKYFVLKIWKENKYSRQNEENFKRELSKTSELEKNDSKSRYIVNIKDYNIKNIDLEIYYFYIMEYIDGLTLSEYLNDKNTELEKIELSYQILEAVEYCNENKIYHGDLHTDNIMITTGTKRRSMPKLIDFSTSFYTKDKYQNLRASWVLINTMEKLLSFINYSYDGYPKRINDIRNIGNTPADWHKLKKQYNQKAIKYVSSEEVVKFYKSLIDIYCFQEAYPNMYYNYSNSLNYSSYISELNTLLLGCPELINSHTISYISSLDISETKIKLGQKDETLDKISRSLRDIAEFQILYSNSMSNGDALEKMNAELLDLGIKNTGLPALNKLKEWQQKRPEAYYSYAKFHNYVTEDYNNNLADYLSIKERYS